MSDAVEAQLQERIDAAWQDETSQGGGFDYGAAEARELLAREAAALRRLCGEALKAGVVKHVTDLEPEPWHRDSEEWREWSRTKRGVETEESKALHEKLEAAAKGEEVL